MPTGEATITSRRPPTLERSTDQTYPMSNDDYWPIRSRVGTLMNLKNADTELISRMAIGFGTSIQRMQYMICIIEAEHFGRLPEKLKEYPIRFTEDGYTTPDQLGSEELLKEKASIERRILAIENQLRVYHSELDFRHAEVPASLFELGIEQWISEQKQFAKNLYLKHCMFYHS